MGAWGVGLYDDDYAADLKQVIALLAKAKINGDRLVEILLDQQGGAVSAEDEAIFWLVVADQCERRGIPCQSAFQQALTIVSGCTDLRRLGDLGLKEKELEKRREILADLAERLHAPRSAKALPTSPKQPKKIFEVGEVYAFPTMAGWARKVWGADNGDFKPDGWGALLVVDCGLLYGLRPWCAIASLAIDSSTAPALADVMESELLYYPQTRGATLCVPQRAHVKRMEAKPLGCLRLESGKARATVSQWCSLKSAVGMGWSISTVAFSAKLPNALSGVKVSDLVVQAG